MGMGDAGAGGDYRRYLGDYRRYLADPIAPITSDYRRQQEANRSLDEDYLTPFERQVCPAVAVSASLPVCLSVRPSVCLSVCRIHFHFT